MSEAPPSGEIKFNNRYYQLEIALPAEIASLKEERDMYRREARTDLLTELPNRRGMQDWIDPRIESLMRQRESKEQRQETVKSLQLGVIDIDKFKDVNDRRGHKTGDLVLVWLAATVREKVRDTDLVARIGGEEFIVAYNNASSEVAQQRFDELREHIASASELMLEAWGIDDRDQLTVSGGLAEFDNYSEHYDDLFLKADAALYIAKQDRNRTVNYNPNNPDMATKVREP